jgi:hypothetical protein
MEADEDDKLADLLPGNEQTPVKHIFFDFDNTISRCHVFKQLAGWEPGVPPPCALTDRGQISRLTELIGQGPCFKYSEEKQAIVAEDSSSGELWTRAALGGCARVQALRALFVELRAKGIVLTVVTKGYVGAVRMLLTEEGLLDNFNTVIGFTGEHYGKNDYDASCKPSQLEAGSECQLQRSKAEYIVKVMQQEGLKVGQAALVEDDPNEIRSVRQPQLLCRAVFVRKRLGMLTTEMDRLRQIAGIATAPASPKAPSAPTPLVPPRVDAEAAVDCSKESNACQAATEKDEALETKVPATSVASWFENSPWIMKDDPDQAEIVRSAQPCIFRRMMTRVERVANKQENLAETVLVDMPPIETITEAPALEATKEADQDVEDQIEASGKNDSFCGNTSADQVSKPIVELHQQTKHPFPEVSAGNSSQNDNEGNLPGMDDADEACDTEYIPDGNESQNAETLTNASSSSQDAASTPPKGMPESTEEMISVVQDPSSENNTESDTSESPIMPICDVADAENNRSKEVE